MPANNVSFAYGLQSAYNSAVKSENTLYFITDTQRIYKGSTLIVQTNVVFTTVEPQFDTSSEGVLYVYTDASGNVSILSKGTTEMKVVGGGVASEVVDGVLDLANFQTGVVVTTIGEGASDTSVPTAKAVKSAIESAVSKIDLTPYDAAFVDVSAKAAPEGQTGTVLTFTPKSGEAKSVTIADIFLASARYDSVTHDLVLTLNDASSSTVTVNLNDLIGNSFSDVVLGADEAFTVELGSGGTLGGYKTGDQIPVDTSLETVVKKLLMKQVPPTYSQPSVSVSNNSGTAAGNYEIGSTITPNIKATFSQADAGALTNIQFQKNNTNVGEAQTSSPATYTEAGFTLDAATSFKAIATYAEGEVKNDNLGQPYPNGHITAGSKTSSNYTFTPYRQGYFYGVLETDSSTPLTSEIIRSGSKKNGAYSSGNLPLISASSVTSPKRIFVACPATNTGVTKVIMPSAMGADCTSDFVKQTPVAVEGAGGYTAINYNVWVYEPASISSDQTFTVTLG